MKISCITLAENTIQSLEQNRIVNYISNYLNKKGLVVNSVHSVCNTLDSLSRVFSTLDEELLFVVGGNSGAFNYELKKNISTILNETIYENEDEALDRYLYDSQFEDNAYMHSQMSLPQRGVDTSQNFVEDKASYAFKVISLYGDNTERFGRLLVIKENGEYHYLLSSGR